jgi:hypothetical protein
MVGKLAIEAEPELKVTTVDLMQSPTPVPPTGTSVPNTAGTHPVDLGTSDSSLTVQFFEERLPSADPVAPIAVAAIAAAKRARVGMAGDITEGREGVHLMQEFERKPRLTLEGVRLKMCFWGFKLECSREESEWSQPPNCHTPRCVESATAPPYATAPP